MRVAVVGLGKMGRAFARRLLLAGHEVTVWNRSPGAADDLAGARVAPTLGDVWSSADACISMVSDDAALQAVTVGDGGLFAGAPGGRCLIDMSTVSVDGSRAVGEAAAAAGVAYLRAPVSGNPAVVDAGNATILVSGPDDAFGAQEAMLRDIGPNVFHLGGGDEARVVKLALNLVLAGTAELMAEAVVLSQKHGVEPAKLLEVMGASAVGSPFVKYKTAALVADDYTATFTSSAMYKDLALAIAAGKSGGVPLPVTALVQQLTQACIASGMADIDLMALVPRLRREAGLPDGLATG
jgi:3-hydroxyisobutyrate dehydrogenase-like beta-hydroxyacid dehydrogenase